MSIKLRLLPRAVSSRVEIWRHRGGSGVLQLIDVAGPSMVPTLRDGDLVLVRPGARIRGGDVVLARFADRPDRYVIKRAERPVDGGWWLRSDNPAAGGDSRTHGPGEVLGRALLVWPRVRADAPRAGRRRWVPRPIGSGTQG